MKGYVYTKVYDEDGNLKFLEEGHNDVHADLLTATHRMLTNPADYDVNNGSQTAYTRSPITGKTTDYYLSDDLAVGTGSNQSATDGVSAVLIAVDAVWDNASANYAVMRGETDPVWGKYNNGTDAVDASTVCTTQRFMVRDIHGESGTGGTLYDAQWVRLQSFTANGDSGDGTFSVAINYATYSFNSGSGLSVGPNDTVVLDWNLEVSAA